MQIGNVEGIDLVDALKKGNLSRLSAITQGASKEHIALLEQWLDEVQAMINELKPDPPPMPMPMPGEMLPGELPPDGGMPLPIDPLAAGPVGPPAAMEPPI